MHKALIATMACLALLGGAAQARELHQRTGPDGIQMAQAQTNATGGQTGGSNRPGSNRPGGGQNTGNNNTNNRPGNRPGNNNRPGNWNNNNNRPGNAWNNNNWRNNRASWNRYHRSWTSPRRFRWTGPNVRPAGWFYRRWTLGAFLPAMFFGQQFWINNWGQFRLDSPPPGTVWVRNGNDALLVDRRTGEVIQVVFNIFF
jgi:Ni/Co efflux regulator RcnB